MGLLLPKVISVQGSAWLRWGLLAALSGAATTPCAEEDPGIPPLAAMCFGCHGMNGVSASPAIPSLAGQNELYLRKRLDELKTGPTPSETMRGVTHGISDGDLKVLANFFARQPYARHGQPVDEARAARGRDVYGQVCSICHTEQGRGVALADYPLLARQSLDYMLNELDHILLRKREVESIKRGSLAKVSRQQIEDAIHYFASQQVTPDQVKTILDEPARGSRRGRNRNQ